MVPLDQRFVDVDRIPTIALILPQRLELLLGFLIAQEALKQVGSFIFVVPPSAQVLLDQVAVARKAPRIIWALTSRLRISIVSLALDELGDSLIQQSVFLFLTRFPPLLRHLRELCKLGLDCCFLLPLLQG